MSSLLTYIQTNNLPCKVYIDATKEDNFVITPTEFTLENSIGDTNYDFIQTNPLLFPTKTSEGLIFDSSERLYSRNSNLFTDAVSYTIINIVKGVNFENNQLIHAAKLNTLVPAALEYSYETLNIRQQYSRVNLNNELLSPTIYIDDDYDIQSLVVNHNIKYGFTAVSINRDEYLFGINKDKGNFNAVSDIYLGNSNTQAKAFSNVFKQLLIFVPQISQTHINYILDVLLTTDILWEDINIDTWNSIDSTLWDLVISN